MFLVVGLVGEEFSMEAVNSKIGSKPSGKVGSSAWSVLGSGGCGCGRYRSFEVALLQEGGVLAGHSGVFVVCFGLGVVSLGWLEEVAVFEEGMDESVAKRVLWLEWGSFPMVVDSWCS
ncbi:hypothetical protein ACP275_10G127300 [Erythranthe tilingii]